MATRKTIVKQAVKAKSKAMKAVAEQSYVDIEALAAELGSMVKGAKAKYDGLDAKTKKQVIAGIAGASALLAGAVGYGIMKKGKPKSSTKRSKKSR